MMWYRENSTGTPPPAFALTNSGGVRASIDTGDITWGEIIGAFPFNNAIVEVVMTGDELWDLVDGIVTKVNVDNGKPVTSFLQVSKEVRVVHDPTRPAGKSHLVDMTINGEKVDRTKQYKIVTVDFLATGGDNFFSPPIKGLATLDTLDEVLIKYVGEKSPINIVPDGRISEGKFTCKRRRAAKMMRSS